MKKIAVSILALGAAFASPVLANEATHNGLTVATPAVETVRDTGQSTRFDAMAQSAFRARTNADAPADAARGSQSGN